MQHLEKITPNYASSMNIEDSENTSNSAVNHLAISTITEQSGESPMELDSETIVVNPTNGESVDKIARNKLLGTFACLPDEVIVHELSHLVKDLLSISQLNSYWNSLAVKEAKRAELRKLCKLIESISEHDLIKKQYPQIIGELKNVINTINISDLLENEKFDIKQFLVSKHSELIDILRKLSISDACSLDADTIKITLVFKDFFNLLTLECILNAIDEYSKYLQEHHLTPHINDELRENILSNTQAKVLYTIFMKDVEMEEEIKPLDFSEYHAVEFTHFHAFIKDKLKNPTPFDSWEDIPSNLLYLKILCVLLTSKQYERVDEIYFKNIRSFDVAAINLWHLEMKSEFGDYQDRAFQLESHL